jgi:hypothetical protein
MPNSSLSSLRHELLTELLKKRAARRSLLSFIELPAEIVRRRSTTPPRRAPEPRARPEAELPGQDAG